MADTEFPCVCGVAEALGDGTPSLKLPTNRPLVYVQDALPGHNQDEIWSWVKEAYARWTAVCDWRGMRILDIHDAPPDAIVHLITVADLGTGGVLADQVLPYTQATVLRMRLNVRIQWKATDGQMSGGFVDPIRTICHETGHFQGHSHWPQGAPPELMEPVLSQVVISPQPTEAKVSASWFGPPVVVQPPAPPQPPTGKRLITLEVDGSVTGARVLSIQ